jgi:phosphoribosylformylglycinamidine synthase
VQIGDPITEKRVLDGLLRARDAALPRDHRLRRRRLSSAVGEMGEAAAPRSSSSACRSSTRLAPQEIWISEAQERMVLAVRPSTSTRCCACSRPRTSRRP